MVLARPLVMDALRFDATAITTAGAIGALIALPLPILISSMAKRVGRKPVVIACFLTTTFGLLLLAVAADTWHFWLVSAAQAILAADLIVLSALVTDVFSPESLGTALALLSATPWIGFVVGLAVGGASIGAFQVAPTLLMAVALSLIALALLLPVSMRKPEIV
jgi:MFS family permease